MRTLKMRGKNVLVKQLAKEMTTQGGIVLADTDTMKAKPRGIVVAVGCLVHSLTPGDMAIWGDYSGQIIEECDSGMTYRIMTEDDILAVEVS